RLQDREDICRDDSPNSFYDPGEYTVNICYNWIDMLINGAAVKMYDDPAQFDRGSKGLTQGLMPGFTPAEGIVGGYVAHILHELGHALFHNLDIPRLGPEEDSADQIAGLIMLQFGSSVALPAIKGTLNTWHHLQATGRFQDKVGYVISRGSLS